MPRDPGDPPPAVAAILSNAYAWEGASASLRSMARPWIDDAAWQIAKADGNELRKRMVSRLPEHIRDLVRGRAMRFMMKMEFATTPDGIDEMRERAAIREFSGGMTREEAELETALDYGLDAFPAITGDI